MDELLAKFLPQFVALARSRVEVAINSATKRDQATTTKLVRELHTLAGEAGLLGLSHVVPLARDCEQKAKLLQGTDGDVEVFLVALRQLAGAIEGITAPKLPAGGGS